jgi:hypothetical protein
MHASMAAASMVRSRWSCSARRERCAPRLPGGQHIRLGMQKSGHPPTPGMR